MERAFKAGNYSDALTQLSGQPQTGFEARMLLDIGLRLRDWNLVERGARDLANCGSPGDRVVGQAYVLYAGRSRSGQATVEEMPVAHGVDKRSAADLAYLKALFAWMDGNAGEARSALRSASPVTTEQRVKVLALQAWSAPTLRQQSELLLAALTRGIEGGVDVGLLGNIAHPLAVLFRELDLAELAPRAEALLTQIPWGRELLPDRFYVERAVAWAMAQRADYIEALRLLDRAAEHALTPAQHALVATDRARICRMAGDSVNVRVAALHAFESLEAIAWEQHLNDEPYAVYTGADILAPVDLERINALIKRADAAMLSSALGAARSPVLPAFRDLAHALVLTNRPEVLRLARRAYRVFHGIGYDYRAANAALRAYDVSGVAHWLSKAQFVARKMPRSILAREVARRSSVLRRLTPRRRELLAAIAEHLTNREIATRLSISENTVKEHIRVLHRLFKVSRRAELAALWLEAKEVA